LLEWHDRLQVQPGGDLRELLGRHDGYVNGGAPAAARIHERVPIREVAGWRLTANVTVPHGAGPFPCLVYLHGGGWVLGSPWTHRRLAAELATLGLVVVSVDYRRAPRHRFPAAVEDAAVAVSWTHARAAEFGGDPDRLLIGGDSAGANLAGAVLATRPPGTPDLRAALLLYGVYDYHRALPTLTALTGGPDAETQLYLEPALFDVLRGDPRLSPGGAGSLAGFPPCWLTVGERDPLREETEALAASLAAAGVAHRVHLAPDAPHGYLQLPTHPAYAGAWASVRGFLSRYG
jgi:acetyl esterase